MLEGERLLGRSTNFLGCEDRLDKATANGGRSDQASPIVLARKKSGSLRMSVYLMSLI